MFLNIVWFASFNIIKSETLAHWRWNSKLESGYKNGKLKGLLLMMATKKKQQTF